MTTKPKARKFRIRRSATPGDAGDVGATSAAPQPVRPAAPAAAQAAPMRPQPAVPPMQSARRPMGNAQPIPDNDLDAQEQVMGHAQTQPQRPPQPQQPQQPMTGMIQSAAEVQGEVDIDAIRREGLTGRQLRMARRVAQKHGLAPTSDFDAVRQLRMRGIDPFQRSTMLELVVPNEGGNGHPPQGGSIPPATPGGAGVPATLGKMQLPQTVNPDQNLPSTEVSPADRRAAEIMAIQRDIARRRRKRLMLLLTRLSFFVFLPTILAGWYFFAVATPMYATKSEFLILQADAKGGSGLGGLLQGTQFATNQDAIAVQSYLNSRDAMQRLDDDMGFKAHFSQDYIDPIQRLATEASDSKAYKLYQKNVKIGYDPTEGVIKMEVVAADPDTSREFSQHLISYAEQRVDDLSKRKRADQMREARESLEKAKAERREAQQKLVQLQEGTFLDPEGEIANIRALIGNVEMQLQEKELALNSQLNNARPNRARVNALQTEVRLLRTELEKQNARLNEATAGSDSLAFKTAQIQMAQADLATADLFLQSALQNEKQTELEANRQVRYLTTSVSPVAPDDPTYPRSFENTILAFLIFAGIYLMVSLTSSILREQVSS